MTQHNIDSTQQYIDRDILNAFNELINKGLTCSLILKHRRGEVTTVLKCTNKRTNVATGPINDAASEPDGRKEKKKRKKGGKKKLENLLLKQQLVEKKGLPPS